MTDPSPYMPWRPLGDGPTYEREQIWLPQLAAQAISSGNPLIDGKTFIDCRIEGPAVLLPVDGCDFDACDMGYAGGDLRNLLLRPVGPQKVIGAIAFRNCTFRRCVFVAVGFTGSPAFTDNFLTVLGGKAS
ncbi:hypothetical protein [Brevundimonas sp.]|uniref:hypothetical protein n=1 Tax=Brevundimonas sp. TaxID=1871086 RepID=UPI002D37205C|nr:hypothetical protein [Brevundimonas sp.]HYC97162.1 hypothetical protein [Brevundimonas sp.]